MTVAAQSKATLTLEGYLPIMAIWLDGIKRGQYLEIDKITSIEIEIKCYTRDISFIIVDGPDPLSFRRVN